MFGSQHAVAFNNAKLAQWPGQALQPARHRMAELAPRRQQRVTRRRWRRGGAGAQSSWARCPASRSQCGAAAGRRGSRNVDIHTNGSCGSRHGRRCDQRSLALCRGTSTAMRNAEHCAGSSIGTGELPSTDLCKPHLQGRPSGLKGGGWSIVSAVGNVSEVVQALVARRQHGAVVGGRWRRTKVQPSGSTQSQLITHYLSLEKLTLTL